MADLTLAQLQANGSIPANSFIVSGGAAMLDVGTLIGTPVSTLTTECVTELSYKLLRACRRAQVAVNQNLQTPNRIDSFAAPVESAPTEINGQLVVVSTVNCRARMPVNLDEITAPLN